MPTRSIGSPPLANPLNTVDLRMAKASIEVHAVPADVIALFFESVAACGMSHKEAAYDMAMDPAQLSRVKSGQARLPFDAVWRLPNHFWLTFRDRIDAAKALTPVNRRAIQRARLLEVIGLLLEEAS